jgi:hypothetical protein
MTMDVDQLVVTEKVRCDACPVMCFIKPGAAGACDRYANVEGVLVRVDPHVVLDRTVAQGGRIVPFVAPGQTWNGHLVGQPYKMPTGIGAGTTYPEYKPAPLIVSSRLYDEDIVTVVTEGIFSYAGVKIKIDTDRHLGHEAALVRAQGEVVGHVTTSEYGSQMLSLGGVQHLTGGSKKEGRVTCEALLDLCNQKAVELTIDDGATLIVQAGKAPIVAGTTEQWMRAGCGSAVIGMFAKLWHNQVDEVVVVDDHITGVLSEHLAGQFLGVPATGIKIEGRRSTAGRYFKVAEPGMGWGGTNIENPLTIVGKFDARKAWPGLRLLMVTTTGEQYRYFVLDEALQPIQTDLPVALLPTVERIRDTCEPGLCTVMFMAGAGGSLRAGVTDNPIALTRSVSSAVTSITCGGAPVFLWPGGGITFMVDVCTLPKNAFGYVPTPAMVAPIEFTLRVADFKAMGGHMEAIRPASSLRSLESSR